MPLDQPDQPAFTHQADHALLVEQLRRWIDTEPLRVVLPASPRRVVLLGRTSAGKTTLLNRLTGASLPTGLGGVTRRSVEIEDGATCWIDTPGIDDPDRAIDRLAPLLDHAHGAIWVIDGLQPVTHTERAVLNIVLPPELPLRVVVSRSDLIRDDAVSVLGRVAELSGHTAICLDLRAGTLPDLRTWHRTPAEEVALQQALNDALAAMNTLAVPVDPEHLRRSLDLRPVVKAFLADLERRHLSFPDLMQAYRDGLAHLVDTLVVGWVADPQLGPHSARMPRLPPTPDPTSDALEVLRLSAAGSVNTLRELRAQTAGWLAEAQLTLLEWQIPQDAGAASAYADALEALQSAMSMPMVSERRSTR